MSGWQYGRMKAAWALRVNDHVFVRVDGLKPTPCYDVKLTEYVRDRESDAEVQLGLFWKPRPGVCIRVLTPYSVRADVYVGRMEVKTVRIDHADGYTDVEVQHVPFPAPAGGAEALKDVSGGEEYTGWSRGSFEEAYQDAVAQIPLRGPDDLVHARIVAQGGMHGGFPGFNDVYVTVRRVDASPPRELAAADRADQADRGCTGVTYSAEQVPGQVIIHAYGEHPTGGWTTRFEQLPIEIWPPQFRLVCTPPDGPVPDVISPFSVWTAFGAQDRVDEVTVHDGDGEHVVPVDQAPDL